MTHHTPLAYRACQVPLRRATNVFGGISITVHAGIYGDVLEADRRWRVAGGNNLWDVRQADTGSYNCRNSVAHSRGVAIDFNWTTNGMTKKRTPCPGDMPAAFYEICWKPLGYGWGNNWKSKCDRMHISKLLSEGGDGVLWRTWDEEDEVPTPAEWEAFVAADKAWKDTYGPKIEQVWRDHGDKQSDGTYKGVLEDVLQPGGAGLGTYLKGMEDRIVARVVAELNTPEE